MARAHLIADRQLELLVGVALFAFGAWLIHEAYEGRGRRTPWPLSVFAPY